MKKTLVATLLAVMLVFSLVACSDGSLDYTEVNLADDGYVTLKDYKDIGLDLSMFVSLPSETEMVNHLSHVKDHLTALDRACADGDIVNIDFAGTIDGVAFDGGSAEETFLLLGSDTMIDGFEDGIVGMSEGEVKTIDVTFPEDYGNDELNGKPAQFEITLNAVYDKSVLEDPEVIAHVEAETDSTDTVWTLISGYATVNKYPEKYLKSVADTIYKNYEYTYRMYGLMENMSTYGITDESCLEEAKKSVGDELIIYAFVQAEGLTYTEEEFNAKAEKLAATYGYASADEFKAAVDKKAIETEVYKDKVIERVTELSKISAEKRQEEFAEEVTGEATEAVTEPVETTAAVTE